MVEKIKQMMTFIYIYICFLFGGGVLSTNFFLDGLDGLTFVSFFASDLGLLKVQII